MEATMVATMTTTSAAGVEVQVHTYANELLVVVGSSLPAFTVTDAATRIARQ